MLSGPWKQRLIRYANTGTDQQFPMRDGLNSPRTILGRKILQRKNMNSSFSFQNKIKGEVRYDEIMSKYTSMRIGGPADVFVLPESLRDLQIILKHRGSCPVWTLGEGTNLLVRDRGIRGIVVSLKNCFKSIKRPVFYKTPDGKERAVIQVDGGVKLSYLAKYAARYGLTGIESLVGIPGSVGGAVVMNAGAEGTEIGQVLRSVKRVNLDGEVETFNKDDITFAYRKTTFPSGDGIVIEAELDLEKGEASEVHRKMDDHISRRSSTQPLTMPNSGSIFKNPEGDSAGRLIESSGLKGCSMGGAGVSIKHANFIVNKGNASAKDVIKLIEHIQTVVEEKTGTKLEQEIVIIGE
ncbi:MAG: UDP-N-acetylenolpyruvoylglucosamine reductase [Nitrospinae bacterium]|nr:UDP-N-acetylenolpyruvoylglucosamine reductase [Nitrospinota bacterium]